MLDGCEDACVQVIVSCPSCGACEDMVKNICLCTSETDCNLCQDCIGGVCTDKCPNECENGVCYYDGQNAFAKNDRKQRRRFF